MRDWKKILLILIPSVIGAFVLLGFGVYYLISIIFAEERPPLDIEAPYLLNYVGEYDSIIAKELGIDFDVRSGGEIIRKPDSLNIQGDKYNLSLKIEPLSTVTLNTNDSLRKYESESLSYSQLDNIILQGEYKQAYGKKRGDIYISKNNTLVRVLEETSFKDNNTPIGSIEVIKGDLNDIYKVFITYYGDKEEDKIKKEFPLSKDDEQEGLKYVNHFEAKNTEGFDFDVIGFGGVRNSIKTKALTQKMLEKVNNDYIEKYDVELNKEELGLYNKEIAKDNNTYFNAIFFKRLIIKDSNIYNFTYFGRGLNLEMDSIFQSDYDNFFFKNIKIYTPEIITRGDQEIFENIQYIVPQSFIKLESSRSNKSKVAIVPTTKIYKKGGINISYNKKDSRDQTYGDIYQESVIKYIKESLSISHKTITDVELVKSSDANIGGFESKGNIFKFSTANGDDFVYIEYLLFDEKTYYKVGFNYGEDEKELLPYFNQLVKSINKIQ